MKEQIRFGVYNAPECRVMALDSSSQMCATSSSVGYSSSSTEELGEENGAWL